MLETIVIGIGYALSAALQPGPLQAFFLSKVSQQGWRCTMPAAFAPLISDGPIALVAILLVGFLPDSFRSLLQLAGGFLLLYFAWSAIRGGRSTPASQEQPSQAVPVTVFQAALINLLNPNPYLGWSLVMGPAVMAAWDQGPALAAALLLSFYLTLISASLGVIYLMGQALLLGPQARRWMSLISALLLVGLSIYFLYQALSRLL
jgi:threonine/homoserine/homoserine lactone efflux protein